MKLGMKLVTGFLIVAMLVGTTGTLGIIATSTVGNSADVIYEEEYPAVKGAKELKLTFETELKLVHGYLLGEEVLEEFDETNEYFDNTLNTLSNQKISTDERTNLAEINRLHTQMVGDAQEAFDARDRANAALVQTNTDMEIMDAAIGGFLDAINAANMSSDRMNTAWDEIMTPHDYIISGGDPAEKTIYASVQSEIEAWPDYALVQTEHEGMVDRIDTLFASYDDYLDAEADMETAMESVGASSTSLSANVDGFITTIESDMADAKVTADSIREAST
ncbi:MAG: MCP four helix bundle domain-containing protein, partial [Desulfobacteraceae bacterium]|nr:MCP four helix bundle domain-containing protein [Desulfobacteraceae bacterium]